MATTGGEEAAVIAQEFIISLDNVPAEVQFLLAEMRERECRINELQMRIQPRAAQYVRHASKGTINEKDTQTLERVSADYELIDRLSDEKVELAHRLKDLLIKHSNRLQAELSRITNPGGDSYIRPAYLPATGRASSAALGPVVGHTATSVQPDSLVYSGASRTPMTSVVSALKAAETSASTPVTASTPAPSNVPVVVEPAVSVSAAPSPAATSATNKRRRLNATQSNSSIQPAAAMPAPSTPSAPRSSGPRPPNGNATLAPTTTSVPSTPSSGRPRRAASTTATNTSPTPNNNSNGGRNTSESTSMSTATNGGDEQDAEAVDGTSSNADEDVDMEDGGDDGPYCVCQEKSYGEMIGCDNGSDCPYQWFHVACVKVQKPLPPTWYCDVCTEKLGFVDNTGTTQAQASGSERAARKRRR